MPTSLRRLLFGPPKDVRDPDAFHKLSLVALLAWVGLGADGLSSSSYGPDESFRQLGEHTGLALFLALATAATVFIISYGYSRIIEQFPSGGGGYVVASALLGPRVGLVSGAALLVDYVLTITISMASGADAVFSFLPPDWHGAKFAVVMVGLVTLTLLNVRGVKESITALTPVFGIFLVTHAILLLVTFGVHLTDVGHVAVSVKDNVSHTVSTLGMVGTLALFARAYSLGGGTYTGIEAVSNGVAMMREPKVLTAKRTMVLMAVSLAVTAGGLLLAYLLVGATPEAGKTMNAVLLERVSGAWQIGGWNVGRWFVIVALVSEGALLFVAAQAGFVDGPRVMANMATDSWLPHRFATLSDRLVMRNGVALMGLAGAAALIYTQGDVGRLVVMYSINVFATFSLSNLAMVTFWWKRRVHHPDWRRHIVVHIVALVLCAGILGITVYEKFLDGGWVTVVATSLVVAACELVRRHYERVGAVLKQLDAAYPAPMGVAAFFAAIDAAARPSDFVEDDIEGLQEHHTQEEPDPKLPVAVLFVGGYTGVGRQAVLALGRMFPGHFPGIVFVSIAVVDSESFKGAEQVAALEERTRGDLLRYEQYARSRGFHASSAYRVGTEVPETAEAVAAELSARFPKAMFVGGQLLFEEDSWWNRLLHNETALIVQRRLQRTGHAMIVVPVPVDLGRRRPILHPGHGGPPNGAAGTPRRVH